MKLLYKDGTRGDDALFSQPAAEQRAYVARIMGLNPDTPDDWPLDVIDRLIVMRRYEGRSAFYKEIGKLLSE